MNNILDIAIPIMKNKSEGKDFHLHTIIQCFLL